MSWRIVGSVDSSHEPGTTHLIKRADNGRLGCDCPKYRFARGEKTCHHIEAFLRTPQHAEYARAHLHATQPDAGAFGPPVTVTWQHPISVEPEAPPRPASPPRATARGVTRPTSKPEPEPATYTVRRAINFDL